MFETLEPLHEMMDKGPQTLKETSFSQNYGNELNEAQKWCKRYKVSNNIKDLNQAWDLYYHVFRLVRKYFFIISRFYPSVFLVKIKNYIGE